MSTRVDVNEIRREAFRAIEQDGLTPICVGLMMAIMALFFLDHRMFLAALPLSMFPMVVGLGRLRQRLTWPRVGFAKLPEPKGVLPIALMTTVALAVGVAVWLLLQAPRFQWLLPLLVGAAFAAGSFGTGWKYGEGGSYVFGAVFLVSGPAALGLVPLGLVPTKAVAVQLWVLAGIAIAVGVLQLRRFLEEHPKPATEASDVDG